MSKLIKKLDDMTVNTVLNEEFIAEITDESVEYKLAGTIMLDETTTDAELDQFIAEVSLAMWGKKIV